MMIVPFPTSEADLSPEFSDDALALEFTKRHGDELRYVAAWGKWLGWDGIRWTSNDTLKVFDKARTVAREFAIACNNADLKLKIANAGRVAAIERLAPSDRRHAATSEVWDADAWLLNTPGGIVDLLSGRLLPHDPERYMTKLAAIAPGGECPLWRQFLAEITDGDTELQGFLQRVAGYALTGSTREHALFFLHGAGGNGKGVFVNTLTAILGDYARVAPVETFTATKNDRHPTDLAMLRGARLVAAQETENGHGWAEAKIKALTGGDKITARFMRQDFFTYTPAFKLMIAANHKPSLSAMNEAIRRRFHLIPFAVTIINPNKELPEKLRAEWPGILAWMIAGCQNWLQEGLNPPDVVIAATEAYLAEEDSLAQWIADCCVTGRDRWWVGDELWRSWQQWAHQNKEPPGSRKAFAEGMAAHGYLNGKQKGARGYACIALKPSERNRICPD